jgi:hypothetical protein
MLIMKLIGVEGAKTPVGAAGQVRPRRSDSDEEAHRTPHGKRATWSGNQLNAFLLIVIDKLFIEYV